MAQTLQLMKNLLSSLFQNLANKKAQENALLQETLAYVPGSICFYEWKGQKFEPIVISNDFYKLHGFDDYKNAASRAENTAESNYKNVHQDDLPGLQKYLDSTKSQLNFEGSHSYRVWHSDKNKYIWLLANVKSVISSDKRHLVCITYTDITEQHELTKKIQETKEAIAMSTKYSRLVHWTLNIDTKEAYAGYDSVYEHDLSYQNAPESIIEQGGVHPDDCDIYREFYQKIYDGAEESECIIRGYVTSAKDFQWLHVYLDRREETADGEHLACGISLNIHDEVCNMKEAEKAKMELQQNQLITEAACTFANMWTFTFNTKTKEVHPNTRLQQEFGFPKHDAGFPESVFKYDIILPEYHDIFCSSIEKLCHGATQVEFDFQTKIYDGNIHWVRLRGDLLKQGDKTSNLAAFSAQLIDVEKTLEARFELEHAKVKGNEDALISYVISDLTSDTILQHEIFIESDYSMKRAGSYSKALSDFVPLIYEADRERLMLLHDRKKLLAAFNQGQTTFSAESKILTLAGKTLWTRNILNLLCDPKTQHVILYDYSYDITDIKTYEEVMNTAASDTYKSLTSLDLKTGYATIVYGKMTYPDFVIGKPMPYDELVYKYRFISQNEQQRKKLIKERSFESITKELSTKNRVDFIDTFTDAEGNVVVEKTVYYCYDKEHGKCIIFKTDESSAFVHEEEKKRELKKALHDVQQAMSENERLSSESNKLCMALFNLIPMVIASNLTKNTYYMMNYDNFTTKKADYDGCYDDLITIGTSTVPDEQKELFFNTYSRENMLKKYQAGKKIVTLEHQQYGDDGVLRWMLTQCIFVPNKATGDIELITLAQDISDRKASEEALREALNQAKIATQAKTDFLSRMSHDMRTPMNAIIGLTALTIDDKNNPQAVQDNMTKMRSSSDFLLGLVNDILDMAKIEDGSVTLKEEPYAYTEFLMNIKTMFIPQCEAKNITFNIQESKLNPVIKTDKIRFNQIFFNVLSNAVKYTPSGGRITYSTENLEFTDDTLSVDFIIQDTGIGMSKDFLQDMYKPFTQENTDVTSELQGSGLGLSITKQLIELMGGTIKIDSAKGKGTTVTIHLSFEYLSRDKKIQPKINIPASEHDFTGKNILLVEDHPLNAQIATRLLEKKGMIVSHAENGRIAVEKFEAAYANAFDAILMDIRMPEMDGLEATAAIRALDKKDSKTIPIIAMSANAYAEDIQKSLDAGMNAHLAKPVEPDKLYKTLAKYI